MCVDTGDPLSGVFLVLSVNELFIRSYLKAYFAKEFLHPVLTLYFNTSLILLYSHFYLSVDLISRSIQKLYSETFGQASEIFS